MSAASRIRVLSERIMTRGFESTAARYMQNVQDHVLAAPGLISIETLKDSQDHHRYVVLSEWESKDHYKAWLDSPSFIEASKKLKEVTTAPKQTRIFEVPKEELFLL